jgi:hypothetical protein
MLAWSSNTVIQLTHAGWRKARALGAVTAQWPRARWLGRPVLTGGQGVALPAETPRGSDGGCVRQGGAVGFLPETVGSDGAEKRVRRDGRAPVAG